MTLRTSGGPPYRYAQAGGVYPLAAFVDGLVDLALAAAETLYGAWACVVDARDTTFFERATRSFLVADGVFATMQLAVAVTGAAPCGRGGAWGRGTCWLACSETRGGAGTRGAADEADEVPTLVAPEAAKNWVGFVGSAPTCRGPPFKVTAP